MSTFGSDSLISKVCLSQSGAVNNDDDDDALEDEKMPLSYIFLFVEIKISLTKTNRRQHKAIVMF